MIEFRDRIAKEKGIEMLVHTNEEAAREGVNPFDHGAAYTDIMKTQALKQGLDKYGFTAAYGGGRRDEEKSRAKERIFSFRNEAMHGTLRIKDLRCGNYTTPKSIRVRACVSSQSLTGLRRTYGSISKERILR